MDQKLPFLPGNSFGDPTKKKYHVSQSLYYKNGYALPRHPVASGVGGHPVNEVHHVTSGSSPLGAAELTYLGKRELGLEGEGGTREETPFIPHYVKYDKMTLHFRGYYLETNDDGEYRVREVKVLYYLEDDTISVREKAKQNSGLGEGPIVRRGRVPKDDEGNCWHWKDLNLGKNIQLYGKTFQIVDCDNFTKSFLESEGVEVDAPSSIPPDPYLTRRKAAEETQAKALSASSRKGGTNIVGEDADKLRRFLAYDKQVLRFYGLWEDRDSEVTHRVPVSLQYYLVDDTIELREIHERNDGRIPFPLLMKRSKVKKVGKEEEEEESRKKKTFPSIILEPSVSELGSVYLAEDLNLGETLRINGRRVLLTDCDTFTRQWYQTQLGRSREQMRAIEVDGGRSDEGKEQNKTVIPPYHGIGSVEDSLQSVLSLHPQPPKKDYAKILAHQGMILRYGAVMESPFPEDQDRQFIVSYRLADEHIFIFEQAKRNSGRRTGRFLEPTKVTVPGCDPDHPTYYQPQHFYIGALITIFRHRFRITAADRYVLTFMEENRTQFNDEVIENIRSYLRDTGKLKDDQEDEQL